MTVVEFYFLITSFHRENSGSPQYTDALTWIGKNNAPEADFSLACSRLAFQTDMHKLFDQLSMSVQNERDYLCHLISYSFLSIYVCV